MKGAVEGLPRGAAAVGARLGGRSAPAGRGPRGATQRPAPQLGALLRIRGILVLCGVARCTSCVPASGVAESLRELVGSCGAWTRGLHTPSSSRGCLSAGRHGNPNVKRMNNLKVKARFRPRARAVARIHFTLRGAGL
mgnify:CR=1 FL=1